MINGQHYSLGLKQHGSPMLLSRAETRNHIYITGKSGTGKSSLLFQSGADRDRSGWLPAVQHARPVSAWKLLNYKSELI
jgi:hypothetical protein